MNIFGSILVLGGIVVVIPTFKSGTTIKIKLLL
jgi:hypothetical protein